MKSVKEQVIDCIGFNPYNKNECLDIIKYESFNIVYIKNQIEEIQLLAIKNGRPMSDRLTAYRFVLINR